MIFYVLAVMPGARHTFFKVSAPSKEHLANNRFWEDARRDIHALTEDEMGAIRKESNLALARGEIMVFEFGHRKDTDPETGSFYVRNIGSHEDYPTFDQVRQYVESTTQLDKTLFVGIVAPSREQHERMFNITDRTKLH